MKDQDDAQDVLAVASPDIGEDEAAQAAWRHFGIAAEARRLAGERDRNFRLRARDGHEYVLKFSHPAEDPRVADFQARALLHVERADPALPVQRVALASTASPAPGIARRTRRRACCGCSATCRACRCRTPRVRRRSDNLARTLARLGLALRGFEHEAGALALPWDIQRADEVAPLRTWPTRRVGRWPSAPWRASPSMPGRRCPACGRRPSTMT